MITARISCPLKTPTQSGKKKQYWLVEYVSSNPSRFISDKMKWTGSNNTLQQIQLKFTSKDEAINFVEKHNMPYEVIEPKKPVIVKKSYADNFK